MTFLVAFARPDFALLASDTRSTTRPAPDAAATSFSDDGVKVFQWDTGWLASGPSVLFRDALLKGRAAIGDLEPIEAALVRERQLTISVGIRNGRCFRRAEKWDGAERFIGDQDLPVALCPNGSDPLTMQLLLNAYQLEIKGRAITDAIHATKRLYHAVYEHTGPQGTISPLLAIALVRASGVRHLVGPIHVLEEVAHA
jgi:hypothetical protein